MKYLWTDRDQFIGVKLYCYNDEVFVTFRDKDVLEIHSPCSGAVVTMEVVRGFPELVESAAESIPSDKGHGQGHSRQGQR